MTEDTSVRPAWRFLHVCYSCADAAPVTDFLAQGLALQLKMSTPMERSDGAILGIDGDVESSAAFVYDARGARTSPAIEVQAWADPAVVGKPVSDPAQVGIQALGFSVPDHETAVDRLTGLGGTVVGGGASPFATRWTTLRDITGVTLDVVGDDSVPAGETRLRHLRITSSDLERSVPWYEGLGFDVIGREEVKDGSFLGITDPVDATAVRLRLPDEPFEAILTEWRDPAGYGRHVEEPFHAGLYRTAVGVEDTRVAHEAMAAAGWTFDREPMSVELRGTPVPDMWICFLSDPDGVPFEFVQRPRSAFRS